MGADGDETADDDRQATGRTDGDEKAGDDAPTRGADGDETAGNDGPTSGADGDERPDYTPEEDRLALYEWVGMLTAGLGFFLPVLPLPVAAYCAYRIRDWKPTTTAAILGIALTTLVFWLLVVVFLIP